MNVMQSMLFGHFTLAAAQAAIPVGMQKFNAAGCDSSALVSDDVYTEETVRKQFHPSNLFIMDCKNTTSDQSVSSVVWFCNETTNKVGMMMYSGVEDCSGTSLASVLMDCNKDDSKNEWTSVSCHPDMSGYHTWPYDYWGDDVTCPATVGPDTGSFTAKLGACRPTSECEGDGNGTWVLKSESWQEVGDTMVNKEYTGNIDCSGEPTKTQTFLCDQCTDMGGSGTSGVVLKCSEKTSAAQASQAFQLAGGALSFWLILFSFQASQE